MKLKRHVTCRRGHEGLEKGKKKPMRKRTRNGREYDNKLIVEQQNRNGKIMKA